MRQKPLDDDQFSDEETARRRDEALRRALNTPPHRRRKRQNGGEIVPDMDAALADLEELIRLTKHAGFDLFGEFQRLADNGTPHLVAQTPGNLRLACGRARAQR